MGALKLFFDLYVFFWVQVSTSMASSYNERKLLTQTEQKRKRKRERDIVAAALCLWKIFLIFPKDRDSQRCSSLSLCGTPQPNFMFQLPCFSYTVMRERERGGGKKKKIQPVILANSIHSLSLFRRRQFQPQRKQISDICSPGKKEKSVHYKAHSQ